jgi:light-regulated signal transduction histidine kinase (bacteriophytochrome)
MSHASASSTRLTEEKLLLAMIHDIRQHLRTSVSRAQMIERESNPPLAAPLGTHLKEILAAGRDMDLLLSRMAQYAMAASRGVDQARGDICVIFDSALRRLADRSNEAEIDSRTLQSCGIQAPYSVEAVVRELLDNALKFRQGPVKITVLVEQSSDKHVFGIKDTGIGFDPRYCEKIMLPLERLHPPDIYGGCGMGLAICQRTVEAFGGQLWAESNVNDGSTFWFSLPV